MFWVDARDVFLFGVKVSISLDVDCFISVFLIPGRGKCCLFVFVNLIRGFRGEL